ncbi:site-specific integrase [Rathayibacter sp. AY1A2]|uniref:tyrosine-type recombinase/integrase n=1 Tax=Rathayibacter sp. AY1A2 TaxID=2080520 RepID=UPI000CE889A4|nr:site-specific integrase [Rathayibacter sp. AY1A2]PPF41330.1 site-specific integrase [Rathayibacter sp. AY1A2]
MPSPRKLPDGRWQARIRKVPGGPQISKTARTKTEVQKWIDETTAALVTGTHVEQKAGAVTLRAYFVEWSERQIWASGTVRGMTLAVESTPFIDRPLRSITRADVELWVKKMQTAPRAGVLNGEPRKVGLAPSTIATRFTNVRTVLRAAVVDKKITADPTVGVKLPRQRKTEASMEIPSAENVRAWLDAADPEWKALIALCAFAGLRLGEAAGLKVGDIDFLRREFHVRRQIQRENGGKVEIRLPKYASERVVTAPAALLEILSEHIALCQLQGLSDAWLFLGSNGNPAHQNTIGYAWRKTKAAAGVDGFRLHSLRHFYASGLIAAGCDIATVQHALGHTSPTVTLRTYTHLWPKAEERTRAAAQGITDAVLGAPEESVRNARPGSA